MANGKAKKVPDPIRRVHGDDTVHDSGVFVRAPSIDERIAELKRAGQGALHDTAARMAQEVVRELARDDEPEGLLTYVMEVAPHLARRVAEQREHNARIRLLANTLHRYARCAAPQAMMHVLVEQLMAALRERCQICSELLQEALVTDIGSSG